jgi:hypothetical protein
VGEVPLPKAWSALCPRLHALGQLDLGPLAGLAARRPAGEGPDTAGVAGADGIRLLERRRRLALSHQAYPYWPSPSCHSRGSRGRTPPRRCGVGYPAVLRHRMHNKEPLAFPCGFLYPRSLCLPVPDKIIAMVFIHRGLIHIHFRTHDLVTLTMPPFFTEVPVAGCYYTVFFLQVLGARAFAKRNTPSVECMAKCSDTAMGVTAFRLQILSQQLKREMRALAVRLTHILPRSRLERICKNPWWASGASRCFPHQPSWTALRVRHDSLHGGEPHA